MIEVKTDYANYMTFLALTGNAFEPNAWDPDASHGFYWAMRWLATQILGKTWMLWISQKGGE